MIKNHKYFQMLISRYKDKDLNYNEIVELKKHLESCHKCREFERKINSISSILQFSNIKTKKNHKNKLFISIASVAAVLIIGIVSVFKVGNNNKTIIANSDDNHEDIIYNSNIPLSSYFNSHDDHIDNNEEDIIMSSYLSYFDK